MAKQEAVPIGEVVKVTAGAGYVFVRFGHENGNKLTLEVPCDSVDWLVEKILSARDAAALMLADES